ncbi:hypothetical protein HZH66_011026 [Vespula vulgaris]|uniref:Uncharacterized protein n=1 Tax=Vespula vulgaris TaxID=7454 RepID=A0A834JDV0_VESVU|nr:hypothetical protein HZH66_011026 [Vespula vulgaris]
MAAAEKEEDEDEGKREEDEEEEEEGILSAQVSHTQDLFRSVKDQKQTTFPLRCRDSSVHVTEHVDGAQRATISLYEKILYCPSEGHKETVVPPV